jgi:hypothetical protein
MWLHNPQDLVANTEYYNVLGAVTVTERDKDKDTEKEAGKKDGKKYQVTS